MVCATEENPLVAVVRHAASSDIQTVIVGGRVLKDNGKLVDVPLREIGDWKGCENVVATAKSSKLGWPEVSKQLKISRIQIQERIDRCNIGLARKQVLAMWGTSDEDDILV